MRDSKNIGLEIQNKLIDAKFKKIEERLSVLETKNVKKIEPLVDFLLMIFRQSLQNLFKGITQDDIDSIKTELMRTKKKEEEKENGY